MGWGSPKNALAIKSQSYPTLQCQWQPCQYGKHCILRWGGQSQRPPQSKGTNVLWAARALESWVGLGPQVIFTLLANTDTLNSKPVGSDTHWPSTPFAFGKGCDISLCIRRQANISVPKRNPFISKKKSMRLWHVSISEGGSTPSLSCRGALKRRSSYVHRCETHTLGATLANVEYVRHRLHEA